MMRWMIFCAAILSLASCATRPAVPEPLAGEFGPTLMRKTTDGYELTNRKLAVGIDERSGAVTLFARNAAAPVGVVPTYDPLPNSSPQTGYVESRDEETWQYFGTTADGQLGWRIIACLHVNELAVTYLVQNKTDHPITGHVRLPVPAGVKADSFDEDPKLSGPQTDGSVLADEHTLQPGERINFATRWTIR